MENNVVDYSVILIVDNIYWTLHHVELFKMLT